MVLSALRKLRALDKQVQIDVVAPKAEFVFYPGTIWVPTGSSSRVVSRTNTSSREAVVRRTSAVTSWASR